MGLYEIGILSSLVAILGVELTMGLLVLRGIGDLTERMDGLSRQIDAFHRELRDELKREIASLRDELKGEIAGLRDELKREIAGLRDELKREIAGVRTN